MPSVHHYSENQKQLICSKLTLLKKKIQINPQMKKAWKLHLCYKMKEIKLNMLRILQVFVHKKPWVFNKFNSKQEIWFQGQRKILNANI